MSRVPIRRDGLVVRFNDAALLTVPTSRGGHQWWVNKGKRHYLKLGEYDFTTKIKDQYLLMPISVFKDWESE